MIASGSSWPSITLVCSDVYTSLKFSGVGDAAIAEKNDVNIGACGTLILNPLRSSGVLMSREPEVIWRKPLSQMRNPLTSRLFSICPCTWLPRPPSSAFHTTS